MVVSIVPGTILWVRLSPRGQNKQRPAVALESPDSEGNLHIVAGSSKAPLDESRGIELPWNPNGHCRTQLRSQTIIDAGWIDCIHVGDVIKIGGVLPGAVLADIQDKVRSIAARSAEQNRKQGLSEGD